MAGWVLLSGVQTTDTTHGQTFPEVADKTFEKDVKPFLEKHCYACHDERRASAGFRIDQLGTDFLKGKTADYWREVIDHINIGDMPPKSRPRPDPKEAFAVVEWVGRQLKKTEREAHLKGGQIVMRRLNRAEYANTVGDLLKLDVHFVAKVYEELPADGKAEGFDRIGSALFFDQTQLEKYLAVADLIAAEAIQTEPPETTKVVWEAERHIRPSRKMVPVFQGFKHKIPLGADFYKCTKTGVEMWNGGQFSPRGSDFSGIPPGPRPHVTEVVKQDGYYRIRVKGGGFPGERGEPIKVQLTYAYKTPIESTHVLEVKGSLEEPGVAELVVFLRAGLDGQKTNLHVTWNALQDVRLSNPEYGMIHLNRLQMTG